MPNKLVSFFCFLFRKLLSLRYRITVKGMEELDQIAKSAHEGVLFLPNHPARVDPILLSLILWPHFHVRPLVTEYVYRQSGIHFVMKMVRALPIPNLETSLNELKIKKAKEAVEELLKGLTKGENFLLYPSGKLKHTGKEILGGASAAHYILQRCPDTRVVLIRTTGLWGSSFSRAYEEKAPDFKRTFWNNVKFLLLNGIFFMPRRNVLIEIEQALNDFPRGGSRLEFNRYLEDWYNRYLVEGKIVDEEPLTKVSYLFWKKKFLEIKKEETVVSKKTRSFSSKIEEEIFTELARLFPHRSITSTMNLATDLGMDSLDIAEVITFLNIHYDIGEVHPEDFTTVQDIVEIAEGKKKKRRKKEESSFHWPEEQTRKEPLPPNGITIPEAFFRTCDRMGKAAACADDLVGVLSYQKLKIAVLALAKRFQKLSGDSIGILLPSSVGAYMVILATLIAKKTPVLLNWTLGPRFLNHMVSLTNVQRVISSWRFLERLTNVEFGDVVEKICFLEDIKKQISFGQKMAAFVLSLQRTKGLLHHWKLNSLKESDPAVILFTSGTEAAPKGVPLSHKNILFDQTQAMRCEHVKKEDVFYGILPPFHSFGFSVVGLLPLLTGIRVVYAPDPTDSYALAEGIQRWKVTLFCSAPAFLKGLLQVATKEQLQSIRFFITGAEKTPQELFRRVSLLNTGAKLIEGYGITECAPIVSLNRPSLPNKGVGQLLEGIEALVIHPETKEILPQGKEGEICVRGDNVFSGYLGKEKDPFILIDHQRWYRTGDLGYFDKEGFLFLSGRRKRFTKIGGEMVSLTGLEDVLKETLGEEEEEEPTIAICAREKEGDKSVLILFTTKDIEKEKVNTILKEAGFSRLVKVSEVKKIDQIPLMAAGKIDYRFLQTLIE